MIDNCIVKSSKSARFLGVIFDYKLSFNQHIAWIQKKCNKAINIVKFLCGIWWGAHPDTLLTIYKSFVRSIIDYCIFVYFPKRKEAIQKLERIQFAAIRTALGLRKSTPVNILMAESKLDFIKDRARYLCNRYLIKIFTCKNSSIHSAIITYHNSIRKKGSNVRELLVSVSVKLYWVKMKFKAIKITIFIVMNTIL